MYIPDSNMYRIINHGNTRKFPYKNLMCNITKGQIIDTDDLEFVNSARALPFIEVIKLSEYTYNQLRELAYKHGVYSKGDKKKDLENKLRKIEVI